MKSKKNLAIIVVFFSVTILVGVLVNNYFSAIDKTAVTAKQVVYMDVRTDEEWEAGHVNDALHFDLNKIEQGQVPDVPKDAEIKIYCRSGRRAETAKSLLIEMGFKNVENIGGYETIREKGTYVCLGKLASCR